MTKDKYFDSLKQIYPSVSRETADDLIGFETLFKKWSKAINLASPNTLETLWERHILDSVQLFKLAPQAKQWLDLGSGGGFPGVVLAILLKETGGSIRLVESNSKKSAFLRNALAQFQTHGQVVNARIESCYQQIQVPEIITARALASLDKLFELTEPWMTKGAKALFQKGRDYQREIDESLLNWKFDLVRHGSAIEADSVILEISNLQRR
ncbi:16S rRNA (guanine(527)-N(7))-methyltransferase RsmG [Pseudochrobactrum saccharolyticum]|uniref:Ribosomal RNA small subunit methyltransferase G n=1 Tax=Pseudochrobactrum saccharolyticum TaxID=354352 RepID=A0A7W8EMH3_9HYPH|nr:16S rRNA (guanine(527)-N(7))-methyltransferase RsmG [Pseudochrobactrum saccharolyticum]KAB0540870.1 16S rRNA (guanine(527)-N(7))-methyltransferase RsmG [Pseudochrobactrum saccharolyticum]MBB5090465.1 16S rRNA (guanine527-N7)-methyltransferase [Pseudochrobactrum saccharolyticum]MDP8252367.1 16S rRNA (guanine(527)-N(7))-methyltransferase RsmG [Pseudochrobactrum saccharolyticum]